MRYYFIRILLMGLLLALAGCDSIKGELINFLGDPDRYQAEGDASDLVAQFSGEDQNRLKAHVSLREVASGFKQPTDIQFVPTQPSLMLVAEKTGALKWKDLKTGRSGTLHAFKVTSQSELGLLGVAFHPDFARNGRMYFNYTVKKNGDTSLITEMTASAPAQMETARLGQERIILSVPQPYSNHNAGQLAFGPDGMLYIGWGDGGFRDDPRGNGQNPATFLGSMLRLDVRTTQAGKAYAIPADNPFLNRPGHLPETFAYGLRNPWRFSFDPQGRLIVADVGQNRWEEINIVEKGSNLGWKIREASHCFDPPENCRTAGLTDPIYEYGRADGQSITGGYVYRAGEIPALKNQYIFGDFVSGRLWALALPAQSSEKVQKVVSLGKWPLLPSTFGRDAQGQVYVADFGSGKIFRLAPK